MFKNYQFSLKSIIFSGYLLLLILLTLIVFNTQKKHYHHQLLSLSNEYLDQINQTLIEKTTSYLMPAIFIAESSAQSIEEGAISQTDFETLEAYSLGVLKPYPQLTAFYMGDKFGNFIMSKKLNDTTIQTKIIKRSIGSPSTKIKVRNIFGRVVDETYNGIIDFDPRTRPWYIGAKKTENRYWTDIYQFYTGNIPGITASYPFFDTNKQFHGVFGIDITLENITDLLSEQKYAKEGFLFIVNDKNKIVASNIPHSNETQFPLHYSDLNNPLIKKTFETQEQVGSEKFIVKFEGNLYFASFKAFPKVFGKNWKILILIPVKAILASPYKQMGYSFFLLLIVIGMAYFISTKIASIIINPIYKMREEFRRIQNNCIDPNTKITTQITEINHTATALNDLKNELNQTKPSKKQKK